MNWVANRAKEHLAMGNRANDVAELDSLFGGIFFIGVSSLIFMVGTVIVIYYKQISRKYEDRDRFVILQLGGARWTQVETDHQPRQSADCLLLPLIFAFIHWPLLPYDATHSQSPQCHQ